MNYQSLIEIVPWTFVAQILNLLLQAWLFKRFLFQPVKKILAERKAQIDRLYDDAEKAQSDAESARTQTADILRDADRKAEAFLAEAKKAAQEKGAAIIADAKSEAAQLRKTAEEDLAAERRRAVNEWKNELGSLAAELAAKVTEKEVDAKKHEELIDGFIREIGDCV